MQKKIGQPIAGTERLCLANSLWTLSFRLPICTRTTQLEAITRFSWSVSWVAALPKGSKLATRRLRSGRSSRRRSPKRKKGRTTFAGTNRVIGSNCIRAAHRATE